MASSTTNLDLTLPVGGENVSRQIINANNVKIDEAVGAVPSGTDLQSQVTALNSKITTKAYSIYLDTATVSDCFSKMNTIPVYGSATFFATGDVMNLLTNGRVTFSASGTIAKSYGAVSTASFEIMCKYAASDFAAFRLTDMTSSSIGTLSFDSLNTRVSANSKISTLYALGQLNIGSNSKIVATSTDSEAVYFIFGTSSNDTGIMSVIQRRKNNGIFVSNAGNQAITATADGNTTTIDVGNWFRGVIMSPSAFSYTLA